MDPPKDDTVASTVGMWLAIVAFDASVLTNIWIQDVAATLSRDGMQPPWVDLVWPAQNMAGAFTSGTLAVKPKIAIPLGFLFALCLDNPSIGVVRSLALLAASRMVGGALLLDIEGRTVMSSLAFCH